MNKKKLIANLTRILFSLAVLIWGIVQWKGLPTEIPLHFDTSLLPDEYGEKKKLIWLFLFAIISFLPAPSVNDENEQKEDKSRYKLIMNWVHTAFMCAIFIIVLALIKKNLT